MKNEVFDSFVFELPYYFIFIRYYHFLTTNINIEGRIEVYQVCPFCLNINAVGRFFYLKYILIFRSFSKKYFFEFQKYDSRVISSSIYENIKLYIDINNNICFVIITSLNYIHLYIRVIIYMFVISTYY